MRSPLGRRIAALLLDYLLILGWIAVLLGTTVAIDVALFGKIPDLLGDGGLAVSELIGFATLTLPVGLYLFLTESGPRHATLGKRVMRLQVVRMDGTPPSRGQILVRTVVKLLPWEFAHFFVFQASWYWLHLGTTDTPNWIIAGLTLANVIPIVYVALVLLTTSRRGPHDFAAGTRVSWAPTNGLRPTTSSAARTAL